MEKFYWNSYGMHFLFNYPVLNYNVAFYRAIIFKEWIDENSYNIKTGPQFVIFNRTNNCTRFLAEPKAKRIFLSCEQSDANLHAAKKYALNMIRLTDDNSIDDTEPTMIMTESQTNSMLLTQYHNFESNTPMWSTTFFCPAQCFNQY